MTIRWDGSRNFIIGGNRALVSRWCKLIAVPALLAVLLLPELPGFARAQCAGASGCGHNMQSMMGQGMMGQGMMAPPRGGDNAHSSASGAKDFDHVCAKCHALPSPKLHTAAQWPQVVDRMRQHSAASGITLDRRTALKIDEYLEKRAKE